MSGVKVSPKKLLEEPELEPWELVLYISCRSDCMHILSSRIVKALKRSSFSTQLRQSMPIYGPVRTLNGERKPVKHDVKSFALYGDMGMRSYSTEAAC